jgi:hypothetical protein
MRYIISVFALAAVVLLPANGALANGEQQLSLGNLYEWGGVNWNSPAATTGGAIWIQTGSTPVMLENQDVNALLRINAPDGSGEFTWITLATLLLSTPEGSGYFDAQNNWIGDAKGINSWWGTPGLIWDPSCTCYGIPNTSNETGPYDHLQIELYLWCGNYDTFAAAAAAGQPVAYSGLGNQLVFIRDPPIPPDDLSNLPAMILKTVLPGDADFDGTVNINDLSKGLTNYDKTLTANWWGSGDFDGNATVDISDLSKLLTDYDKTAGLSVGAKAVPEPATSILLAAGFLGSWARVRRKRKQSL